MRCTAETALSLLDRCVALLAHTGLSESFIRFGIIGTLGFCWDTATVYLLRAHTGLYIAGTCGFFIAATTNWLMNRLWTFRHQEHARAHVQWAKFIAANALGFIINRGLFFILVSKIQLFAGQPVLAIAAGSCAGLVFNYFLSKQFVFR